MSRHTKSADEHGNAHQRGYPKAIKLIEQFALFPQIVNACNPSPIGCSVL
jgi:hypothetical protein